MVNSVVFLFGSGISRPAGYPCVKQITDQIRSGENTIHHTDGRYYPSTPSSLPDEEVDYVNTVVEVINAAVPFIESYYQSYRTPNYEDIYFLLSQVRDSEYGEYDNPAIQPVSDKLRKALGAVLSRKKRLSDDNWTLEEAVDEACNYIKDTVAFALSRKPTTMEHLGFLTQAASTAKAVHFFTLNHDILLERFLDNCHISFRDGFGKPENEVRYWNPGLVSCFTKGVAIYHLHGSVDWYLLRPTNGTWEDERYGIPVKEDPWHTNALDGRRQWPIEGRPGFLIGTFNKILRYTDEIYVDLHCRFSEVLRKTSRVIVCGYGFGDKAINSQLVRWLYTDPDTEPKKYLVVAHRDPDQLRAHARGAVERHWQEWVDRQRMVFVTKQVEQLKWTDLEPHL